MSGQRVSRKAVEETQQESATADQQEPGSPPEQGTDEKDRERTGQHQARENREEEPPA